MLEVINWGMSVFCRVPLNEIAVKFPLQFGLPQRLVYLLQVPRGNLILG